MKPINIILAVTIIVIATAFYYFYDPEKTTLIPRCVAYSVTGYRCPACGLQRALHQFLHGNISEALRYNYFLLLCIPYAALYVFALLLQHTRRYRTASVRITKTLYSATALKVFLALYIAWWIIRNIAGV
ncbi:MAG: DUF2752 domain-containing protein [Bacteroidaceae bacterium]|nr:DUF2752 domain-containing protein [Bacteroidaceae bacterium]